MSKKVFGLLGLLTVASLVLAACGPAPATEPPATEAPEAPGTEAPEAFECMDAIGCVEVAAGDPIRIASALVISGPNASLGLDSQYGVEIAIQFKGDVLGHPVELQAEDDGCNAEGGQAAGQKVVSDPSIVGVIGTSCSGAGVPMAQVISDAGYFMVSPSNTAPSLTDPDQAWRPGYLRTAHNDKVQGAAMADYAFNVLGLATAAAIHDGDPYTEGLANSFREAFEALGGTVVAFTAVNVGDTDMRPVLTSVASAEGGAPEFLFFPVFTNECVFLAIQALEVAGLENTVRAAADGCFSDTVITNLGDAEEGMWFSGPDLAYASATYEEFLVAYQENYGSEPLSVFHAHGFDAANMIFACIESTAHQNAEGDLLIGRQEMRDCLYATSGFEGITGTLTCNEFGDCADPKIAVYEIDGGEYVPVYP
ncbi:MAG TPA: branched-chain amino acid ABC transporter substrate-binding protein [Anaerolineales bacterium]|jgi:branched-chain amino acid transport system substrate-binding protein|nr:branched-chain amino acid ABC transporter substrate-binding protein [Anaerolineales bacterium]